MYNRYYPYLYNHSEMPLPPPASISVPPSPKPPKQKKKLDFKCLKKDNAEEKLDDLNSEYAMNVQEESYLNIIEKLMSLYINSSYLILKKKDIVVNNDVYLLENDKYIDEIYNRLNKFENETEYYVNMINAWLICELFIKRRDKTLEFLKNNKLNKFTINKAISKCRDSYRVSNKDKEILLKYRK